MPAILWADGRIQRADTWQGLLDAVRVLPWNKHMDEGKLRSVLAKRALVWSGTHIDAWGHPRQLFAEMARAEMLRIVSQREVPQLRLALGEEGPQ